MLVFVPRRFGVGGCAAAAASAAAPRRRGRASSHVRRPVPRILGCQVRAARSRRRRERFGARAVGSGGGGCRPPSGAGNGPGRRPRLRQAWRGAGRCCDVWRGVFDAGVLRNESFGRQQVQLRPRRAAADVQRIEHRHARAGRVGFVLVRLHAFRPRLVLCHAFGAASLHLPVHRLREGVRRLSSGVGGGEGVDADVHHPWRRWAFAIKAVRSGLRASVRGELRAEHLASHARVCVRACAHVLYLVRSSGVWSPWRPAVCELECKPALFASPSCFLERGGSVCERRHVVAASVLRRAGRGTRCAAACAGQRVERGGSVPEWDRRIGRRLQASLRAFRPLVRL